MTQEIREKWSNQFTYQVPLGGIFTVVVRKCLLDSNFSWNILQVLRIFLLEWPAEIADLPFISFTKHIWCVMKQVWMLPVSWYIAFFLQLEIHSNLFSCWTPFVPYTSVQIPQHYIKEDQKFKGIICFWGYSWKLPMGKKLLMMLCHLCSHSSYTEA